MLGLCVRFTLSAKPNLCYNLSGSCDNHFPEPDPRSAMAKSIVRKICKPCKSATRKITKPCKSATRKICKPCKSATRKITK